MGAVAQNFARLVLAGCVGFILLMIVGFGIATSDMRGKDLKELRDKLYTTSCLEYKEASTFERWTTYDHWQMGWCADYVERM